MRGNGLRAENYVAVADLDPSTADFLLAELRDRGVAAYASDSPDPGPGGPVDRLYVDADAEEVVRGMIDDRLTGPGGSADAGSAIFDPDSDFFDSAFADIVAGFHQNPGREAGTWSAIEDVDGRSTDQAEPSNPDPAPTQSYIGWEDLLRPEPGVPDPPPDPEERYVPPPPPPVPRGTARTRAAWAAVLGGPAVLFVAAIVGWHLEDWVLLVCAVAFLGGFVGLVAGLRTGDEDDDGDDGAVV